MAEQLSLSGVAAPGPEILCTVAGGREATPEQAAALGARDPHAFIEAGAGTGKTGVLVARVRDELLDAARAALAAGEEPGTAPGRVSAAHERAAGRACEQVVAITFTEIAAAELRERTRRELRRFAETGTGDQLALALSRQALSRITTIHGLCSRLLASHPIEAGIEPGFRQMDEAEAGAMFAAAYGEALEALAGDDAAIVEALAIAGGAALAELVETVHTESRALGVPVALGDFGEPDPESDQRELIESLRGIHAAIGRLVGEADQRYAKRKREAGALDFADLEIGARDLLRSSPAIAAEEGADLRLICVDEFQDTNDLQMEVVRGLLGPSTRLLTVGDELQSIYGFRHANVEVFRAARGQGSVHPLTGNFRSHPELIATINALTGAAFRTRPSAGRVRGLTIGADSTGEPVFDEGDGLAPGEPRAELIVVRGPKGGDAPVPDEAVRLGLKPLPTTEAGALAHRLRELVDGEGFEAGEIAVLFRALTDSRPFEAAFAAAGLNPRVLGGGGFWKAQTVVDALSVLAVIANPRSDPDLLAALASPAAGVSPDGLWLLRTIAGKRVPLWLGIEALIDPEGEPADEAEGRADAIAALDPDDRERLGQFGRMIDSLRHRAGTLPLGALIEAAADDSGLRLAASLAPDGAQRRANLRKLARRAREHERVFGRDLRLFIAEARRQARVNSREPQAIAPGEHDGVTLMTIHGAKGLEFPLVAIPCLGRGLSSGGSSGPFRARLAAGEVERAARIPRQIGDAVELPGFAELREAGREDDYDEELRLAYVAMTRARSRLVLSGVLADGELENEPPSASILRRLLRAWGASADDGVITIPGGPVVEPGQDAITEAEQGSLRLCVTQPAPGAAFPSAAPDNEPAPAPTRRVPITTAEPPLLRGHVSASALKSFGRCGYRFYAEELLRLPADEPPWQRGTGAAIGTAVHDLLERSARSRWAMPGGGAIAAALLAAGLEPGEKHVRSTRELVEAWFGSPVFAAISAERLPAAELPLTMRLGPVVVRGFLDLFVERAALDGGEPAPLVVDYKTDRLGDAEPGELAERYRIQSAVYAIAAGRSAGTESGGIAARTAFVFLRDPGKPLITEFTAADLERAEAELASLAKAMAAGEYRVTDAPSATLCRDCPARRDLCTHSFDPEGNPVEKAADGG